MLWWRPHCLCAWEVWVQPGSNLPPCCPVGFAALSSARVECPCAPGPQNRVLHGGIFCH